MQTWEREFGNPEVMSVQINFTLQFAFDMIMFTQFAFDMIMFPQCS